MKRTSGIILSLLLFLSLSLPAQERDRTELEQALRTLVERKRAETGIAVILNGTDTVTVNDAGRTFPPARFSTCSTGLPQMRPVLCW